MTQKQAIALKIKLFAYYINEGFSVHSARRKSGIAVYHGHEQEMFRRNSEYVSICEFAELRTKKKQNPLKYKTKLEEVMELLDSGLS